MLNVPDIDQNFILKCRYTILAQDGVSQFLRWLKQCIKPLGKMYVYLQTVISLLFIILVFFLYMNVRYISTKGSNFLWLSTVILKIAYKVTDRRAGDVASCYADASLAEKELHWKTTRTLDEMCK